MFLWFCHSLFNCPLKKTKMLSYFDAIKLIISRFRLPSHGACWQRAWTRTHRAGPSEAEHPASPQTDLQPEFVQGAGAFLNSESFLCISGETLRSRSSSQAAAQSDGGEGMVGEQR